MACINDVIPVEVLRDEVFARLYHNARHAQFVCKRWYTHFWPPRVSAYVARERVREECTAGTLYKELAPCGMVFDIIRYDLRELFWFKCRKCQLNTRVRSSNVNVNATVHATCDPYTIEFHALIYSPAWIEYWLIALAPAWQADNTNHTRVNNLTPLLIAAVAAAYVHAQPALLDIVLHEYSTHAVAAAYQLARDQHICNTTCDPAVREAARRAVNERFAQNRSPHRTIRGELFNSVAVVAYIMNWPAVIGIKCTHDSRYHNLHFTLDVLSRSSALAHSSALARSSIDGTYELPTCAVWVGAPSLIPRIIEHNRDVKRTYDGLENYEHLAVDGARYRATADELMPLTSIIGWSAVLYHAVLWCNYSTIADLATHARAAGVRPNALVVLADTRCALPAEWKNTLAAAASTRDGLVELIHEFNAALCSIRSRSQDEANELLRRLSEFISGR